MAHEGYQRRAETSSASPRHFGWLLAVVFAVAAALTAWKGHSAWPAWIAASAVAAGIGWLRPAWLTWPLRGWMALGHLLGRIVNPLLLGLMFGLLFVPLALWFRLIGRDALRRRLDPDAASYWIDREPQELGARMRRPF